MGKWRAVGIALSTLGIVFGVGWVVLLRETQPLSPSTLTRSDEETLLGLARRELEAVLSGAEAPQVNPESVSRDLRGNGAAFVSLTVDGILRGCMIDAFSAHEPLYKNVLRNAALAATADPRFPSVLLDELPAIQIEISVLGPLERLRYRDPEELRDRLTPGEDGVVLITALGTSTFLPQVWQTFPEPAEFLAQLCLKQGSAGDCWRGETQPEVWIYRVIHFAER